LDALWSAVLPGQIFWGVSLIIVAAIIVVAARRASESGQKRG
jgi:hypothetical protein